MALSHKLVSIPGSERQPLPHAQAVGAPAPDERIEVTLRVRRRPSRETQANAEALGAASPRTRRYLSREEFAAQQGADPAELAKVEAFARGHGLAVVESDRARRSVVLSGTAMALSNAFGVALRHYEYPGGSYRGRTGSVHLPEELAGVVEAVLGLDDRPIAKPHFQRAGAAPGVVSRARGSSFTPPQLAKLYNFPTGVDGQGQCIFFFPVCPALPGTRGTPCAVVDSMRGRPRFDLLNTSDRSPTTCCPSPIPRPPATW
jgi:kumamolisin